MYKHSGKRISDLFIAVTGLCILSPLFIFLAILLWITTNGKPFFRQPRPGLNQVVFTLIKFSTMTNQRDSHGELLPDHLRITRIGKFLRHTSLDELPQLWNVLAGDMSVIGPRPLLVDYLPLYNSFQSQRHLVRPGITGWAQVNGRNSISWSEKFEYDIWYVQHISFQLDMKILLLTLFKLMAGKNVDMNSTTTAEKFTG
jgi:undecaprenyl phosphate N,N'-diacetylbacillosamine 1-phosphate transferase